MARARAEAGWATAAAETARVAAARATAAAGSAGAESTVVEEVAAVARVAVKVAAVRAEVATAVVAVTAVVKVAAATVVAMAVEEGAVMGAAVASVAGAAGTAVARAAVARAEVMVAEARVRGTPGAAGSAEEDCSTEAAPEDVYRAKEGEQLAQATDRPMRCAALRCAAMRFASPPFPPTGLELQITRSKGDRSCHSAKAAPQSSEEHWPTFSLSGAARTARNRPQIAPCREKTASFITHGHLTGSKIRRPFNRIQNSYLS